MSICDDGTRKSSNQPSISDLLTLIFAGVIYQKVPARSSEEQRALI